jgi:hypothetical protein
MNLYACNPYFCPKDVSIPCIADMLNAHQLVFWEWCNSQDENHSNVLIFQYFKAER